jgi:hypothetical protein
MAVVDLIARLLAAFVAAVRFFQHPDRASGAGLLAAGAYLAAY